jgi:hypothetical protein
MTTFLSEYAHIVTDLPHLAAEVTFMLVIDVLLLGCALPLVKKWCKREHAKIDAEHGVDHEQAIIHWPAPEDQVQTPV